ncbi:MAG: LptF/LptG family permease [Nitrospirae bacterium]|nr:LptF/LptG family permease [Nitrospirota bacterium]
MIIHRAISRELSINLVVAVSFLSFVLFMEKFVRMTRLVVGKGVTLQDFLKVFLFLQPSILLLSAPMALLIAVFLTYGRMSSDNEIVALKSSGVSFWFISKPAIMFSIMSFAVLLFISIYILPKSIHSFKRTLYEVIVKKASMTIEEETFSTVFTGTVIFVKDIPSENIFDGIFVYTDAGSSVKNPLVIVAESGSIATHPEGGVLELNMHNGLIHTLTDRGSSEITFKKYNLILIATIETKGERKLDEIDFLTLWNGMGGNILWQVELNRRLAIPFSCLIFGLLGPALSMRIGKTGRVGSFSFSLSILVFYYLLFIFGEGSAKAGKLPAFIGVWGANLLFGMASILLFYMAYKDRGFKVKSLKLKVISHG